MKDPLLVPMILLAIFLAAGCNEDKRLVELAREADNRQAEQNHEMAQQNQQIAEATRQLVEADARSRQELLALERELKAERAEVDRQRDTLEDERRQIAQSRHWDSAAAEAIGGGVILLATLLPLALAAYLLHHVTRSNPDEALAEVLVGEIVSDQPVLLPPGDERFLAVTALPADQVDRPAGEKEQTG
ncbi:MAG TPA: hypothetical protein VHC22_02045 [Pirellulales bacterium]|nr:hypothetical protein [Pirellulales bacterium]